MMDVQRSGLRVVRRLLSTPRFAVFAISILAVGIGTTTAIHAIARSILGPRCQGLQSVVNVYQERPPQRWLTRADYDFVVANNTVFDEVVPWTFFFARLTPNAGLSVGESVGGLYFSLLGVSAERGRVIAPTDDDLSAPPVAVISHATWASLYHGTRDIVGQRITVDDHGFEIVGVVPPSFRGSYLPGVRPTSVWIPLNHARLANPIRAASEAQIGSIYAKARLRQGTTLADAERDMSRLSRAKSAVTPERRPERTASTALHVEAATAMPVSMNAGASRIIAVAVNTLLTAVYCVMLVVVATLANLIVCRNLKRQHELAVRASLGASRLALWYETAVEALLCVIVGGVASIPVGYAVGRLLATDVAFSDDLVLNFPSPTVGDASLPFLATIALTVVIVALVPALRASRPAVAPLLGAATPAVTSRSGGRRLVIGVQMMFVTLMVAVAAWSWGRLLGAATEETSIPLHRLAVMNVDLSQYARVRGQGPSEVNELLGALEKTSDVEASAALLALPVGEGRRLAIVSGGVSAPKFYTALVEGTPTILQVLGAPVLRGRSLAATDTNDDEAPAVVSDSLAKSLFGGLDVVGKKLYLRRTEQTSEMRVIVGVVATRLSAGDSRVNGVLYVPLVNYPNGPIAVAALARTSARQVMQVMPQILADVAPGLAPLTVRRGVDLAGPERRSLFVLATVAAVLACIAFAVAAAGLYGVMSVAVEARAREFAVRVAFGAQSSQITGLVLREGLVPVIIGVAVGTVVSGLVFSALAMLGFGHPSKVGAASMAAMVLGLVVTAAAACLEPVRGTLRTDPQSVLKSL
jgi:predicted permease